jgi:succinate dehydrogenase hydrophobic anchor subunit
MQNNDGIQKKENKWLADRSAGIFILLLSCGIAVFTIAWPLKEMLSGSDNVLYSSNTITWTLLGLLFGLVYTILGGENLNKLIAPSDSKGIIRLIIFTVVFFAVLFGLMAAWDSLVNALGYG